MLLNSSQKTIIIDVLEENVYEEDFIFTIVCLNGSYSIVITHEYSWQNRLFFDIYSIYMYTIYREDACTLLIVF